MTVPIWLWWLAVAALALPAFLGSFLLAEGSRQLRLARLWSPTMVVLVAALVVTVDRAHVSEDELYDATDRVARSLNGTLGGGLQGRVEVAAEAELGHAVSVSGPVSGPWSSRANDTEREERFIVEDTDESGLAGDGSGAAVCLVATVTSVVDNQQVISNLTETRLSVERGRCEE